MSNRNNTQQSLNLASLPRVIPSRFRSVLSRLRHAVAICIRQSQALLPRFLLVGSPTDRPTGLAADDDAAATAAAAGRYLNGPLSVMSGTRKGRPCVYYFCVIDFLQPWNAAKRAERAVKGLAGYDIREISCAEPEFYGKRFLAFIEANVS